MGNGLIGKKVTIKCPDSWANGEWGIIKAFDGEYYYIAIANGEDELVFERSEFTVNREPGAERRKGYL